MSTLAAISALFLFGCGSSTKNPSATACSSCHDRPPAGTESPNRSGAHAKHNALAGVTDVCDTCHSGAGYGTEKHFNGFVEVQFMSVYSAKSGTATYNADGTCSNVSCHGGKTTPAWLNGTLARNAPCYQSCHELGTALGTPQYNSYYSGGHWYMTFLATCDFCHDLKKLAVNHFSNLNTPAIEGPASATIMSTLTYSPSGTAGIGLFINPDVCGACHAFPIKWQ